MPGSNASSDGFDRSPLHAETGGEVEVKHEAPPQQDPAPAEAETAVKTEEPPVEGREAGGGAGLSEVPDKKEPNLGPTPQPTGTTTAGKIFCGGLTTDTVEQDLKAHFEVGSLRVHVTGAHGIACAPSMRARHARMTGALRSYQLMACALRGRVSVVDVLRPAPAPCRPRPPPLLYQFLSS